MNLFLICIALVSSTKQQSSLFSLKEPKEKTNSKMQIRDMAGYWRQSTGCHQTENPAYIFISSDNTSDNCRWVFVRNNGKFEKVASPVQSGKIEVEKHTTNEIVQYWWKQGEKQRRKWTVGKYVKDHSIEWKWELGDNRKDVTISQYDKVSEDEVPQEVKDVLNPKVWIRRRSPTTTFRIDAKSLDHYNYTQGFQGRERKESVPTIDRLRRGQEAQQEIRETSARSRSPKILSSISSASSSSRPLINSPSILPSRALTTHPSSDATSSATISPASSPSTVRNNEPMVSPKRNRNFNTKEKRFFLELDKRVKAEEVYEKEQQKKKHQEKKAIEEENKKKKEEQIQANREKKIKKQLKKVEEEMERQRLQKQFG